MKKANEMRIISIENNAIAKWCETVLQEKIEQRAFKGYDDVRIDTDTIPSRLSRSTITSYVAKYVGDFGYHVHTLNNDKNMDIYW